MKVSMSLREFATAVTQALMRNVYSKLHNMKDKESYNATFIERFNFEVVGVMAEMVFVKAHDRWFNASINSYHKEGDCFGYEIRGIQKPWHKLIIRERDDESRDYVLIYVDLPESIILGWINGKDAKNPLYLDSPNDGETAWFVPQSALRPVTEILGN
jgi:hypothetical protein